MKKVISLMLLASLCMGAQKTSAQTETQNYVTITTESGDYDGQWYFNVAPYEAEFVPGCWVDWNNNGVKEDGEEITIADWMDSVSHELVSNTITIYGDITYLNLYGLTLTDVDLSHTSVLADVDLSGNLLQSIDLSKNTSIKKINLGENPLKTIDFVNAPQFKSIALSMNQELTSLDISTQKELQEFIFTDNENISNFDFTANPNLDFLYLEAVPIKKLDLTPNKKLTQLLVAFTDLDEIKLPESPKMKTVSLYCNKLSGTLDVSQYKHLEDVFLQNNNIDNLVLAKDIKELYIISCFMNNLQTASFMPVINNLYDRTQEEGLERGCIFMVDSEPFESDVEDKNSLTESAVLEAINKGWDVIDYAGANMYPYIGVDDATGIKDARKTQRDIIVTEIAGQTAVQAPVSMIGKTIYVYDMTGSLIATKRISSPLTRITELSGKKGVFMFKAGRQCVKAEIK